jgi:hypothetical protein
VLLERNILLTFMKLIWDGEWQKKKQRVTGEITCSVLW